MRDVHGERKSAYSISNMHRPRLYGLAVGQKCPNSLQRRWKSPADRTGQGLLRDGAVMTDWQPMDTAPRDRMILIHSVNSNTVPVKIGKWSGGWVNVANGYPLVNASRWAEIPDWSNLPKRKIMDKKTSISDRDLFIYNRRKTGETNEAIGKSYKISKGRVSQIFMKVNKKLFASTE